MSVGNSLYLIENLLIQGNEIGYIKRWSSRLLQGHSNPALGIYLEVSHPVTLL